MAQESLLQEMHLFLKILLNFYCATTLTNSAYRSGLLQLNLSSVFHCRHFKNHLLAVAGHVFCTWAYSASSNEDLLIFLHALGLSY